ncbi:putative late blight resistance protein-like protein R1A-10 [Forsythia ovata]|uniref:Late blight resistance protein-like protein R1A-10 n=1 Tax=Forsythia ovata TaxID=205694 RepID=A0ABD1PXK0_9LAMI
MVDEHSEHLINKFLNNFREAEEEYPDLPLLVALQNIANSLDVKKLNPEMLMERRDCLYDLIDALNQCINMANERGRRRKALIGSKILSLPGLVKYLWDVIRTRSKLKEIRKKLWKMRDLRIDEHEITSQVLVIEREALKWINLSEYHGLDEQTEKIENLLCETEGNIAIGIVGMSGSGKSALARKVFFSSRVEQLFELMLWVDLSNAMGSEKKYECISLEKDRVEKIYCGFDLCGLLTEPFLYPPRKCLIVLDCVRHAIEGLDTFIQRILNGPVNGSVIVTSTRVEATKKLLPVEKNSHLHPIEPLREEDCWRIFEDSIGRKHFVFKRTQRNNFTSFDGEALSPSKTEILSKMKNEILNRCNGLPLAVKILAEIIPLQLHCNSGKKITSEETCEKKILDGISSLEYTYMTTMPWTSFVTNFMEKKFKPQKLIDLKDDLHEINDALVEHIGLAEDRHGNGKASATRTVEEDAIISKVLVIKKDNLINIYLSEYHGLDDQKVKIENLLCESVGDKAIGIVGMGGSGKSALARKDIFSSSVELLFELILWIDLSKAMGSEKKYESNYT